MDITYIPMARGFVYLAVVPFSKLAFQAVASLSMVAVSILRLDFGLRHSASRRLQDALACASQAGRYSFQAPISSFAPALTVRGVHRAFARSKTGIAFSPWRQRASLSGTTCSSQRLVAQRSNALWTVVLCGLYEGVATPSASISRYLSTFINGRRPPLEALTA